MQGFRVIIAAAALVAAFIGQASAAETFKPFVLGSKGAGTVAAKAEEVKAKLAAAGFQTVGVYSPYPTATVMAVTNDALKAAAAKSKFGGYGAVHRVAVTDVGGEIQVAYSNPVYWGHAFRMAEDLKGEAAKLAGALGNQGEFGPKDGMDAEDVRSYRYMFGMERFSDPVELASHPDFATATAAVEKGLAAGTRQVTKVYRVDIPGKEEAVFGVAMNGTAGEGDTRNDAFIMKEVDFKPLRSTPHLPYEMLVAGGKVYALSARFRIAASFPDLSMMGSNSFMNIMSAPDNISGALSAAAGGNWKPAN
ncbi:hypothetical protein [Magnetospirillum sp. UT-4]|uniref:hypothetical protein n=1 Tax=Magnetospirillum sp. UT-4 TaxID=2681467 RepID=UPI001382B289|nr:hypothetical protein [Magnetospirillum sp. UT-4]CAA7616964.1 conserved exported hypothetical protein [Magnetospirillum sp. UT-4]